MGASGDDPQTPGEVIGEENSRVAPDGRSQRPRERDAQATRQAILDAAELIFARDGFGGARIDAIADESGYNKSLIFAYFTDKQTLYRSVVWCMRDKVTQQLSGLIAHFATTGEAPTHAQTREFIEESVRWTFDLFISHPRKLHMLGWEMAEGWQTFTMMSDDGAFPQRKQWVADIVAFLRRAQEAGHIRADIDVHLLVTQVMNLTLAHLLSLPRYEALFPGVDLSSSDALIHAREQIVQLFTHGALTPPQESH